MLDLWLTLLLTLNNPDHPRALSPQTARTQIERVATAQYGPKEWRCLDRLVYRESRWNPTAKNATSSARGLFQLLRLPPNFTPLQQYARAVKYLDRRYRGSPCRALRHSVHVGWY